MIYMTYTIYIINIEHPLQHPHDLLHISTPSISPTSSAHVDVSVINFYEPFKNTYEVFYIIYTISNV